MEATIKQLLIEFASGKSSREAVLAKLPPDFHLTKEYVRAELTAAMTQSDADALDRTINLLWLYDDSTGFIDLLNQLLLIPHH